MIVMCPYDRWGTSLLAAVFDVLCPVDAGTEHRG
jgi:hypothetical protein